ncbi:MAG: SDR family oxidoreductase [Deltaproteobacteria bacterium]|nr:SDR family oxidoreductase [Deltaproteobacteria bacterium]
MTYLDEMFGLANRTTIVAGGAGAIGSAMSEALLKAGAKVVIWSRSDDSLRIVQANLREIENSRDRIFTYRVDTNSEPQVTKALEQCKKEVGDAEILINAVGGNMGKSNLVETDLGLFPRIIELNLMAGLMVPTKVIAAHWIKHSIKGTIINLASMASYNPLSGVWAYDAAKAAVLNLTKATANELARHGIRVNAIAPGFFLGKQNRALLVDQKTNELTERGRAVIAHTPWGRFGDINELAGVTLFLASDKASGFVTGVCIPVDGGYLAYNI